MNVEPGSDVQPSRSPQPSPAGVPKQPAFPKVTVPKGPAAVEPPSRPGSPGVLETYLQAFVAVQDAAGLSAAIERELEKENSPERLRKFAGLALQLNQMRTAQRVYEKLLTIQGDDPEALRWLGALSFQQAKYSQAEDYLTRYLARGPGDYQSNYYYGEILLRRKDASARGHFQRALSQIEKVSPKPYAMRLVEAHLLERTGRVDEAISAFETLLKQHPQDKNLRAEYVTVLIDRGKYKDAQRVLALP